MKFSGRLQIEAEPREWLKTDLSLAQGRLELTSGSEVLGSWSMAHVKAERVEGDRFELLLGDDRALFAADDALAFSYEALPHLSKKHIIAGPTGLRGRIRNSLRGSERQANEPKPEKPAPSVQATQPAAGDNGNGSNPTNHPVARRLRELIEAASQEQPSQEDALIDEPRNNTWEPDNVGQTEPALLPAVAEEAADVSKLGPIEPVSTALPEIAELGRAEPATDWWPKTAPSTPLPTDMGTTSPPRPPAIRLDLEAAFSKVSSTSDQVPEDRVMSAIEGVLSEVRQGNLSPVQVSAVTALVQAVTDLVAARRSSSNNS